MINWIIGGILVVVVVLAARYVWKKVKSGGCAGGCSGCGCGCHHAEEHNK